MKFDVIIKGGNVVFRDGVRKADIGIKNEKISCIAEEITADGIEVIHADWTICNAWHD